MRAVPIQMPYTRPHGTLALAGFLGATFLVAAVSTLYTVPAIPTWYAALTKPRFNPPNQVFGPVWTALYALMAIAAWLVWKRPDSWFRQVGLLWFGIQLALNFAWSLVFFLGHRIGMAFLEILLLWLAIAATMVFFFRTSKVAGWMFAPYLAWVSFASVLNLAIWVKN